MNKLYSFVLVLVQKLLNLLAKVRCKVGMCCGSKCSSECSGNDVKPRWKGVKGLDGDKVEE